MNIEWDFIASTGEWAGAVAVVATLFYLARQIRQQNVIAKYTAWQSFHVEANRLNASYDQARLRILRLGLENPALLADDEAAEFSFILRNYTNIMLMGYRAWQDGLMSESDWDEIVQGYGTILDCPGGKEWIGNQRAFFSDFFDEVDRRYESKLEVDFWMGRNAVDDEDRD